MILYGERISRRMILLFTLMFGIAIAVEAQTPTEELTIMPLGFHVPAYWDADLLYLIVGRLISGRNHETGLPQRNSPGSPQQSRFAVYRRCTCRLLDYAHTGIG